jgi:hypothetical protein
MQVMTDYEKQILEQKKKLKEDLLSWLSSDPLDAAPLIDDDVLEKLWQRGFRNKRVLHCGASRE